ncbi:hypothetical protein [Streptomyces pinistramenti]|uniref:hypothetical protein n=1 Tax=Streptomyces pinistramenti TaxID=2884812 RepID=UPI001D08B258|nr:hypothetical protein [Streptomyces pinistramenti]MCB5906548.1 hypothetical protein [Streptomyces pinistramenti]
MRRGAGLAALALTTFVVVTAKLRPVRAGLGVSESPVGLLVMVCAFTCCGASTPAGGR